MSRTPFSEPLVQVLLFGGLCMFIDSFGVLGGGLALAGLGGLALGLTVLAWIGSLSILLPAFPVLAWLFVARRRQAGPFGIGLFLGIAIGLSAALTLGRSYLSTVSTELHVFGLAAAGFGVVTALIAPLAFPAVRGSGVARVHVAAAHRGAGGRGDLPAVAGDGRAVGGGGAAGGRAHRAGHPAVRCRPSAGRPTRP